MEAMRIMSAPEMLRTDPAHAGISPLTTNFGVKHDAPLSSIKENTFASYLVGAVDKMNGQQLEVGRVTEQLVTDPDSVDIHDVTTAMAKAQMSLSLAHTVIDRLVSGWNELSTSR